MITWFSSRWWVNLTNWIKEKLPTKSQTRLFDAWSNFTTGPLRSCFCTGNTSCQNPSWPPYLLLGNTGNPSSTQMSGTQSSIVDRNHLHNQNLHHSFYSAHNHQQATDQIPYHYDDCLHCFEFYFGHWIPSPMPTYPGAMGFVLNRRVLE